MQSRRIVFTRASDAGPELVLAARALAAELRSDGWEAAVAEGGAHLDSSAPFVVSLESGQSALSPHYWKLEIERGRGDLILSRDGIVRAAIPMVVSIEPLPVRVPRVLVLGGGTARFMRMTLKTSEELSRRRSNARMVCWGLPGDELLKARAFEEIHLELTADELARLLGSCAAVLDPAEDPEESTLLATIGRAAGLPVVTRVEGDGMRADEWSAEAFADGVQAAISAVPASPRSAANAAAILAEALER